MKAVEAGNTKIAKLLLAHGADSNDVNEAQPVRLALEFPCCIFYCSTDIVACVV